MINRAEFTLIGVCVIAAFGFVGYQIFRASMTRTNATDFSSNGVRVAFSIESNTNGKLLIRATFTPTNGFHLYSKDLDPEKSRGIGLATRLELLPHPEVKVAGPVVTDMTPQTHHIKELDITVDLYPDGPVTFRLPIEIVGTATNVPARLAVSYMACQTDGVCLFPVERQIINVRICDLQTAAQRNIGN